MNEFLATTLANLNGNNFNELTVVIGNESCDLDSAVSAIVFANFLSWQYNQIRCKVCTKAHRGEAEMPKKDDIFVPILNVDRCDYELKTEVVYYFKNKGINDSYLVFRDDFDLEGLLNQSKSKVVLVDHHVLAKRDKFLAPFVTEIIDHRPVDKSDWIYKDDVRSTIETVGSCCTLVAQRIKDLSTLLAKDVDFFNAYPLCTEMLRATIILDTVNFSTDLNKATPHDKDITQFLESLMKLRNLKEDRQREHDALIAARKNVANLTPAQLLKKDVKIVGDVYIPSFPILVKEFLHRPGALEAVSEALQNNNCSVALLLGMDLTEGLQRDTALYSPRTPEKAIQLSKYLEGATNPSLGLSREQLSAAKECSYYWQLNLSASRKQQREHDALIAARKNVANLTPAQLLKKDVKIVGDVYIPSFPILVKEFLHRPGALEAVSEALQNNNCSVALLLGMDLTEGLQRDTALYSPRTPEKAIQLSKYLEGATNPSLGLSREQLSAAKECSYYWQLNLSASRKQYIPTINTFTSIK